TITTPAPQHVSGEVELRTGISIRVRLPPSKQTSVLRLVMAKWEVKREFRSNLDNTHLRTICLGKPVLYKPGERPISDEPVPSDFYGRYLGHVEAVRSDTEIEVSCKDGVQRHVAAKDLRLEATTATVSEYEQTLSERAAGARSIWHRTQELGFILTSSGRRNNSVLRDRLEAVRKFLGQD